ncbi:MAG: hypothetical protein ACREV3_03005 [Gammaproteobacteria bacterium]
MTNETETPRGTDHHGIFTIKPGTEVTFLDLHAILDQAHSLLFALDDRLVRAKSPRKCFPLP